MTTQGQRSKSALRLVLSDDRSRKITPQPILTASVLGVFQIYQKTTPEVTYSAGKFRGFCCGWVLGNAHCVCHCHCQTVEIALDRLEGGQY